MYFFSYTQRTHFFILLAFLVFSKILPNAIAQEEQQEESTELEQDTAQLEEQEPLEETIETSVLGNFGYFFLINAYAGKAVTLSVDGQLLSSQRLEEGVATGTCPLQTGGRNLRLTWGEEQEDEFIDVRLSVSEEECEYLIFYPEYERDEKTGELLEIPTIRTLPVEAENSWNLTVLSVCQSPRSTFLVNENPVTLTRLDPIPVERWSGQSLSLESTSGRFLGRYEFEEPASFLCIIWEDEEQKLQLLLQQLY